MITGQVCHMTFTGHNTECIMTVHLSCMSHDIYQTWHSLYKHDRIPITHIKFLLNSSLTHSWLWNNSSKLIRHTTGPVLNMECRAICESIQFEPLWIDSDWITLSELLLNQFWQQINAFRCQTSACSKTTFWDTSV